MKDNNKQDSTQYMLIMKALQNCI